MFAIKNDTDLQRDVLDELAWDQSVDVSQIGVTAAEGVVTLTGHVPSYIEKLTAEQVTKRVHGVRGVANEIEVRPPESHLRDDADVAAAAVHALQWDAQVPDGAIQVAVRHGFVTLDGKVEHQFQRRAAERAVRRLTGTREVNNEITVEPNTAGTPDSTAHDAGEDARVSIEAALRRSATVNSSQISVEIEGHTVILSGDVHSHAELDEVQRIACAACGVSCVENCLTITPWGFGPADEWGY